MPQPYFAWIQGEKNKLKNKVNESINLITICIHALQFQSTMYMRGPNWTSKAFGGEKCIEQL